MAVACAVALVIAGSACHAQCAHEEPAGYRTDNYRSPVPATLCGATVVKAEDVARAWREKSAVLVDVMPRPPKPDNLPAGTLWRDPVRESVPGASWLPNVGYGVLAPAIEQYLMSRLENLTGGDKTRALIFFCERDCWMSWNAAKRAVALGYRTVAWFPDGTDGWREADLPFTQIQPVP